MVCRTATSSIAMLLALGGCATQQAATAPATAKPEAGPIPPTGSEQSAQQGPRPITVTSYGELAEWDTDNDAQISKEEFDRRLREHAVFDDWDGDGDGEATDREFVTGLYEAWDVDGDEVVDVYEYRWGSGAWFAGGDLYGTFEDWDDDGRLEPGEVTVAIYRAWDTNGDGALNVAEWRWW